MANNRKNTLKAANIDTTKFFSLTLPDGLKPGSKITLTISEDGTPVFVDEIEKKISENGYVSNNRLFRRWVMAQMFRMLNYKGRDGKNGYDAYLNHFHDYKYQFEVMIDELHTLARMEKEGGQDFEIRKSFFTKGVVIATCNDYIKRLEMFLRSKPLMWRENVLCFKHQGHYIPFRDINALFLAPVRALVKRIELARNYAEMERELKVFFSNMIKLPSDTPKCSAWKSAFKGAGAYYTLQNLIRFHGVRLIHEYTFRLLDMKESEIYLEAKRKETAGEGYKLFAFMKEVIRLNNFDFKERMNELYR